MYNENVCFCYTRRCIMTTNILLYKKMYNDIKYFYYTRRCIIKCLFLLYKKMYNEIFVSVIQEDV